MIRNSVNIRRFEVVANGLGNLLDQVVFTGGAIVELLVEDKEIISFRPTYDIDGVIKVSTAHEYMQFEEKLRAQRFRHATTVIPDAPLCRWIFEDILVDIMPHKHSVMQFTNTWYAKAIKKPKHVKLPSGKTIKIFNEEYFLASKFEALLSRGGSDYRLCKDLEDIVTLIHATPSLEGIINIADQAVKKYLNKQFSTLKKRPFIEEEIASYFPSTKDGIEMSKEVLATIYALA